MGRLAIRPDLRVRDLEGEVVVLDPRDGVVHRLRGPAADTFRQIRTARGVEPPRIDREVIAVLLHASILTDVPGARAASRRAVVAGSAAAALGLTSLVLPSASASASVVTFASGGTGQLLHDDEGTPLTSGAADGEAQLLGFSTAGGPYEFTVDAGGAASLAVAIIAVGGGGGGANGGGGGGQAVQRFVRLEDGARFRIVVGAAGPRGSGYLTAGGAGGTSSVQRHPDEGGATVVAVSGGLGGGAVQQFSSVGGAGGGSGGAEGAEGGAGGPSGEGGGGGGAGGPGAAAVGGVAGAGGSGYLISNIFTGAYRLGGGGGGGIYAGTAGQGADGGGAGSVNYGTSGNGVAGTGGGGGGAPGVGGNAGEGAEGRVYIRYFGRPPAVVISPSVG